MHLVSNDLLNPRQYGFRRFHGTTTAIAIADEEVALSLANKRRANIVLRDVAKTFDKVWHQGIRHRLLQLDIPRSLTKLLSNFIEGQKVKLKVTR